MNEIVKLPKGISIEEYQMRQFEEAGNAQPKFCRDCKWIEMDPSGDLAYARCGHEAAAKPQTNDLVSGREEDREANFYCSSMRAGACAQGIFWEPKE